MNQSATRARRSHLRVIAFAITPLLLAVACGSSDNGTKTAGGSTSTSSKPTGTPIKIAAIGNNEGPAAPTLGGYAKGVRVWVDWINANGGIDGHPVDLQIEDNNYDPGRHAQLMREAVQSGVVAFVGNNAYSGGAAGVQVAEELKVPVIGGDTPDPYWGASPMYFPPNTESVKVLDAYVRGFAGQIKAAGLKKMAIVACVESEACKATIQLFTKGGEDHGFDVVYSASVSGSAPDFTAQCLAMKDKGVQFVVLGVQTQVIERVIDNCKAQNFTPRPVLVGEEVQPEMNKDPRYEGMVGPGTVVPFFADNTPATKQMQSAFKAYGKGTVPSPGAVEGWVAAKVFEKAVRYAASVGKIDSAGILEGLWRFKDEDLGGLSIPLTFNRNAANPQKTCWFELHVQNGKWASNDKKAECA